MSKGRYKKVSSTDWCLDRSDCKHGKDSLFGGRQKLKREAEEEIEQADDMWPMFEDYDMTPDGPVYHLNSDWGKEL